MFVFGFIGNIAMILFCCTIKLMTLWPFYWRLFSHVLISIDTWLQIITMQQQITVHMISLKTWYQLWRIQRRLHIELTTHFSNMTRYLHIAVYNFIENMPSTYFSLYTTVSSSSIYRYIPTSYDSCYNTYVLAICFHFSR